MMKSTRVARSSLVLTLIAMILAIAASTAWAERPGTEEIPFSESNLFFELNNTDGDLGIHSLIDGEPWRKLALRDPDERRILSIFLRGRLGRQGLTELFFESAEPSFDELDPQDFFDRFPEGEYEIEGETLDGQEMESEAVVTHLLPAPPENVQVSGLEAAEDCDADPLPAASTPVVISWDAVTLSHPDLGRTNEPIQVVKYQIVVEREEPSSLVMSVDLPPGVTWFEIPEGFTDLDTGDGFKFEILVREESGNQTALESCFELE